MLSLVVLCFILTVTSECFAKDFPSFLPRCYIDDPNINDCILNATRILRPQVRQGIKEIKLPPFDPLVTEFGMSQQDSPITNFTIYFWNFTIRGVDNYDFKEIQLDAKTLTLRGRIHFPSVTGTAICDVTGDYLTIHAHGKGPALGKYESTDLMFEITGEKIKRKSAEYYSPKDVKIKMVIDDFKVNFEDTFGENRALGKLLTDLMNQNSKIVIDVIAPTYSKVIETMWMRYLKLLTRKFPYTELFPYSI